MGEKTPTYSNILALREGVQLHEERFFVKNQAVISNFDYDLLKLHLINLEKKYPEYSCLTSPVYRNIKPPTKFGQNTRHVKRMLGLEKGKTATDIRDFARQITLGKISRHVHYIFEPNVVGVDVEIVYLRGKFERAVLRGDGFEGMDVTWNVRRLKGFRMRLYDQVRPCPEILSIHAKFYLTEVDLYNLNYLQGREGERPFLSSPEFLTSFLTSDKLLDSDFARVPVKYLSWDILEGDQDCVSYYEIREALSEWRLPIQLEVTRPFKSPLHAIQYRDYLVKDAIQFPFEYDGVIVKVYETSIREELGASRTTLRWAVHLQTPPLRQTTRVTAINFTTMADGHVSASADVEPIYFDGINVTTAKFMEAREVEEEDVRIGDKVVLTQLGGQQPFVSHRNRIDARSGPRVKVRIPTACPVCSSDLEVFNNRLRCPNRKKCPAQTLLRLLHFTGEDAFGIRDLGHSRCLKLIENNIISDPADLFTLKWRDLLSLPHVKERRAKSIIREIRKSRRITLRRFLFALKIPYIGQIGTGELQRVMHTLDGVMEASLTSLIKLRGVGPVGAQSIYFYFKNPDNLAFISKLLANGVVPYNPHMVGHRKKIFKGMVIIVIGSFRKYRLRELTELIEKEGGRVIRHVAPTADLLVHGRGQGIREQVLKSRRFYIREWGEAEFLRHLLQHGVG